MIDDAMHADSRPFLRQRVDQEILVPDAGMKPLGLMSADDPGCVGSLSERSVR
jgi:hypothetical protein